MSLTPDCYLPALIQLSKPASYLASISFYWSDKHQKFLKFTNNSLKRHQITTYLHSLAVLSMLLQTFLFWEHNLSKLLISSFGLIVLTFTLITVWVYHLKQHKALYLINQIIKTSKQLAATTSLSKLDSKEKLIKLMAPLFHWSAMSVPFVFVGGVVLSMPCLNSSFAYYLLPECTSPSSPSLSPHFILFLLINLLLWSYSIQCAVFVVIGVTMLSSMSIRRFLIIYHHQLLHPPISSKSTLIYRQIQILTGLLNTLHSTWILVPLLITVSSHQVFSTYGLIRFHNDHLNFLTYCLFLILPCQGVLVIMGMFTALSDVFRMSKKVKGHLTRSHRGSKWLSRWHKGCPLIKIKFGALNYVDSMTPLMFENFALAQTANMLLVK